MNSVMVRHPCEQQKWTAELHDWDACVWSGDAYKVHIADVSPSVKSKEEFYAVANLIAAAPDLLSALRALLPGAEAMGWDLSMAHAALAKAEGKPDDSRQARGATVDSARPTLCEPCNDD